MEGGKGRGGGGSIKIKKIKVKGTEEIAFLGHHGLLFEEHILLQIKSCNIIWN